MACTTSDIYNPQGHFLRTTDWSPDPHAMFLRSLFSGTIKDQDTRVKNAVRTLIRCAILFLREIHAAQTIAVNCRTLDYATAFINKIYGTEGTMMTKAQIEAVEKTADFNPILQSLMIFVENCHKRDQAMVESEDDQSLECPEAICFLAALVEFLRSEAEAVTRPFLKSFTGSSLEEKIMQGIGSDLLACVFHLNDDVSRTDAYGKKKVGSPILPLDHVPCDLILYNIASMYGIPFETLAPSHDFISILQIRIASAKVGMVKPTPTPAVPKSRSAPPSSMSLTVIIGNCRKIFRPLQPPAKRARITAS